MTFLKTLKQEEIIIGVNFVKNGKDYSNSVNRKFIGFSGSSLYYVNNSMNNQEDEDSGEEESDQSVTDNDYFSFVFSKNNPVTFEFNQKTKSILITDQQKLLSLNKTIYTIGDFYFYMTSSSENFHLEFEHIKK